MVAVDICNLALSYLGDSATVASITPPEGSAQAQHCARFYPVALGVLLESHDWNFATKRAELALVNDLYCEGWRFAYAQPSDATDIISVLPRHEYPGGQFRGNTNPMECELRAVRNFDVETLNGSVVILSNAERAVARYCVSTVQPGVFPALFTDALAFKLASMIAGPLLKGDAGAAESKRCLEMHVGILEQAKGQDANQRRGNYRPQASWIDARA